MKLLAHKIFEALREKYPNMLVMIPIDTDVLIDTDINSFYEIPCTYSAQGKIENCIIFVVTNPPTDLTIHIQMEYELNVKLPLLDYSIDESIIEKLDMLLYFHSDLKVEYKLTCDEYQFIDNDNHD